MNRFQLGPLLFTLGCQSPDSGGAKDTARSPSGGVDCTEIGCTDSFEGTFSPPFTAGGAYVFLADIDGDGSTCSGSLPLNGDFSCDGDLQVAQSGSALPEEDQSLPSFVVFEAAFVTLTLTVTLDGAEQATWNHSPEWEIVHPNGPECGPTCTVASTTLSWP